MKETLKKELEAIADRLKAIAEETQADNEGNDNGKGTTVIFFIGTAEPRQVRGTEYKAFAGIAGNHEQAHNMFHKVHDNLF